MLDDKFLVSVTWNRVIRSNITTEMEVYAKNRYVALAYAMREFTPPSDVYHKNPIVDAKVVCVDTNPHRTVEDLSSNLVIDDGQDD